MGFRLGPSEVSGSGLRRFQARAFGGFIAWLEAVG